MNKKFLKKMLEQTLAMANDKEGVKEEYCLQDDHDFYVFMFGYMRQLLEDILAEIS